MQEDLTTKICKVCGKIFDFLIIAIFTVVILMVATLVIQKFIYKNNVPSLFGYRVLQVMSGSMSGEFETGDTILIKNVKNKEDLKIGDVIVYRIEGNKLIAHRIVDIENLDGKTVYTTKGDANNAIDQVRPEFQDVVGVYVCKAHAIGSLIKFMQNPAGLEIIIVIPILIIWWILVKEKKREKLWNSRRQKRLKYEAEHKNT